VLRYSLLTTSIRTVAGNVPPALVVALVRTGVWSAEKGVAYARQDPSPYDRVSTLAGLVPLVDSTLKDAVAHEALAAARDVGGTQQAEVLAALAPDLPDAALEDALALARAITTPPTDEGTDSLRAVWLVLVTRLPIADAVPAARNDAPAWARSTLLACASSRAEEPLRSEVLNQALEGALANDSELGVATSLQHMAPYLTEPAQERALDAVAAFDGMVSRQLALESLAPFLAPAPAGRALELAAMLDQPARTFAALADRLPQQREHVLSRALDAAREVHEFARAPTLADIGPRLDGALLDAAVAEALRIADPNGRARALAGLVDGLPPRARREAQRQLLEAGLADDPEYRGQSLAVAAPHLPLPLRRTALAAARELDDESRRVTALEALLPELPEPEALVAALELAAEELRARALASLAPSSPPDVLERAVAAALELGSESNRRTALDGLIPHLASELLLEVLAGVRAARDDAVRVKAVAALADGSPDQASAGILARALEDAAHVHDGRERVQTLAELAPRFDEPAATELLAQALREASALENDLARESALRLLGPLLPPALAEAALAAAGSPYAAAGAIGSLAEPRRAQAIAEALQTALAIEEPSAREVALNALAPLLPEELAERAFGATKEVTPEFVAAGALAALAPRLPERALPEAFELAEQMHPSSRATALAALVPRMPRAEAIVAAAELQGGPYRAQALLALSPWSEEELPAVLPAARAIEEPVWHARVLLALRPAATAPLSEQLLDEALDATGRIPFEEPRSETLATALPQLVALPRQALLPRWRRLLSALEARSRADVLSAVAALAPVLKRIGGDEAVQESVDAIRDVAAWWP
jgi:hypothetical protein